jgi:hypothetical protein
MTTTTTTTLTHPTDAERRDLDTHDRIMALLEEVLDQWTQALAATDLAGSAHGPASTSLRSAERIWHRRECERYRRQLRGLLQELADKTDAEGDV